MLFLHAAAALSTYPTIQEIEDYRISQSLVMTVLNDGPKTEEVTVMIDPYSQYLAGYITIDPQSFKIAPNSRRNIEISMDFPKDLSPEKHTLTLVPVSKGTKGQRAEFYFTVPGTAKHDFRIASVVVDNITTDDSLLVDIVLNNLGNVIARAFPVIEIYNSSGLFDEIEYKSMVMVMPYSKYNLSIRHDLLDGIPGEYKVLTRFRYADDQLLTRTDEKYFTITQEASIAKEASNYWLIGLAGAILILLFFAIKANFFSRMIDMLYFRQMEDYKESEKKRTARLKLKIKRLEREMASLVNETDTFVKSSNLWLKNNLGKYEFR